MAPVVSTGLTVTGLRTQRVQYDRTIRSPPTSIGGTLKRSTEPLQVVARNDPWDTLATFAAIVIGGAIAAAVLSAFTQVPCPYCNRPIAKNAKQCPHCGTWLTW